MTAEVRAWVLVLASGTIAFPLVGLMRPLAHGRPGLLDTSFGTQGATRIVFPGGRDNASAMAIQPDGKIVIAGSASNGFDDDFAVVRLNVDGSPDTGFGSGGRLLIPVGDSEDRAYAVAIDAMGRIVLAGSATDTSTTALPQFAVVRLDSTGALDPTFNGSGKLVFRAFSDSSDILKTVALDGSGRIVVAGRSAYYPSGSSTPADAMVRSEEHTSELQSHVNLVCRLLLEKKKKKTYGAMVGKEPTANQPS